MAALDYSVLNLDTAVARLDAPILALGEPYDGVTVLALPAGLNASVRLGTNRDAIPLAQGMELHFVDRDGDPLLIDEGLFLTHLAGPGVMTLLVSRGGARG